MNYKKKYKWALTGFIVMVVLNLGVLSTILWVKYKAHDHNHDRNGSVSFRVQRFIEHRLDLSDAQKEAFKELRQEHFRKSRTLYSRIWNNRKALYNELKGGKSEGAGARIDSLTQLIGETQARLDSAIYDHFSKVRDICNEEQKEEFDRIMERVIQRLDPERWRSKKRESD